MANNSLGKAERKAMDLLQQSKITLHRYFDNNELLEKAALSCAMLSAWNVKESVYADFNEGSVYMIYREAYLILSNQLANQTK